MKNTTIRDFSFAILAGLTTCFTSPQITRGEDARAVPSIDVKFSAEPEIPKRQLTFEESKEEVKLELFAADSKLLDQRYAATVALRLPDRRGPRRGPTRSFSTLAPDLKVLYYSALFNRFSSYQYIRTLEPAALFKRLAENTPAEHRPAEEVLSLLLDDEYHFRVAPDSNQSRDPDVGPARLEVQVFGPTVQATKSMAIALLDLYDYGISRPIQEQLIADMQGRKARLAELLARFNAEQAKVESLAKQFEECDDISSDMLTELGAQKWSIAVDITGTQARIDACNKILNSDVQHPVAIRQQVESIRIAAEIELVGLTARGDAIAKIIEDGKQRLGLLREKLEQERIVSRTEGDIREQIGVIGEREEGRKYYMPMAVVDNKIWIRPIKWEAAQVP